MLHRLKVALTVFSLCFVLSGVATATTVSFTQVPNLALTAPLTIVGNATGWNINASGQVIGYATVKTTGLDPGRANAWIYTSGTAGTDLNSGGLNGVSLPYTAASDAYAINNSGTVGGVLF